MSNRKTPREFATVAAHGGAPTATVGPIVPPVSLAATFTAASTKDFEDIYAGRKPGYVYTRNANPTTEAFEHAVAALEGTHGAIATASGMGAVTLALMGLTKAGGRVLALEEVYGGTARFFADVLPRFGVTVDRYQAGDDAGLAVGLAKKPDVVFIESPTNPVLRVIDVTATAAAAHAAGAIVVMDATFASPANMQPASLGVDVVLHSASKYIGGHSDVLAGVLAADTPVLERLRPVARLLGAALAPDVAFRALRGLKTLPLRVAAANANAQAVAEFLTTRSDVVAVHYPGLPTHAGHAIARREMPGGFGGVLSFELPDKATAARFADGLKLVQNAPSLGGVESLVSLPVVHSHRGFDAATLARHGVTEGTVRLALGIEATTDLLADVTQALDAAAKGA